MNIRQDSFTPVKLILLTGAFIILTGNWAFFDGVTNIYPIADNNAFFLASLFVFCYAIIVLLALIFSLILPTRLVLSGFILLAAATAYYADQLGIVIDDDMIRNMLETNLSEASDLITTGFLLRFTLLGILPTFLIWQMPYKHSGFLTTLRFKTQTAAIFVAIIALCIAPLSDHYSSFFRQHQPLRFYSNPAYPIYSAGKYISNKIKSTESHEYHQLTQSAKANHATGRELVIIVVGETARADRFSLNGYEKNTNPILSRTPNIISYTDVSSCGTSTTISVPCMFSYYGRENFQRNESEDTQNILDILKMAGVNVLWRDNNSDSKGVANRVTFQDFKSPTVNTNCDIECRDTGMLNGLQDYIDKQDGDILIVLHQMGSHGPAYFKRYPKAFEKFTPDCQTAELSKCSIEEINNAYDNTILYTDYFLSKVIMLLKDNTPAYKTSMLYVSDHGESLGENNLYLHGLPYMFAPKTQIHVPVIVWASESSDIDFVKSLALKDEKNSQDILFSTLLSIFEVKTDLSLQDKQPLVKIKDTDL